MVFSYNYRVILGKIMTEQGRSESGKFTQKSDEPRYIRSIRLTNSTWETLGAIATVRGITRADLLEQLVKEGVISQSQSQEFNDVEKTAAEIEKLIEQVLADPVVTRNGKDKGAAKRALEALLKLLN
jgi:predicted DNA-binding ribbon-helix-helix protein